MTEQQIQNPEQVIKITRLGVIVGLALLAIVYFFIKDLFPEDELVIIRLVFILQAVASMVALIILPKHIRKAAQKSGLAQDESSSNDVFFS